MSSVLTGLWVMLFKIYKDTTFLRKLMFYDNDIF